MPVKWTIFTLLKALFLFIQGTKGLERSNSFKCINSTKMHHHRLSGILTYYLML